ncbi:Gfo/Idh/MocA family protein [Streptococcus uberis]|uniref:Gfo/Idh/MocA family protein n=1 Tax=Streptococcus uberis TaxID=1349 RepID=UPI000542A150|nr:Gfo/Idh/MocA family oxidoreductase [Streptococcus uberis]KHD41390.1 NAD(P)-dependent oxidoreductase [Streptococcus hongkongensis]KKF42549.1 NAD(P)-dependent oxidoreductase [Streptococcus uberis C9359]KKF44569.1 NAD(P)-dependent oxidoreductase [Streptococcus uberis Ab71]KKF46477.1 NAD(P)-dependent oxidoreductase [Streptococcus uberis C8329]KKF52575.1 NAD(P)-dependent oxidoreductase [Streptococcus uberis C5388]
MKLTVVGTGKIVEEALPIITATNGIQVQALVSTPRSQEKAKALADHYQIQDLYTDLEEALTNPNTDTVYVATPNHLHYEMTKAALLAGKHVICEKPFTLKEAQAQELAEIAKRKQLILLEAITNLYLENFAVLKEELANLGDIKIVDCNYSQYSSRYDAFKEGVIAPAFDPEKGGGALRDLNIYNIHLVVALFGLPKTVNYLPNMERGVDTSGILLMDYLDFKVVCIAAKDCSAEVRTTIQGNRGSLIVAGESNTLPQVQVTENGIEPRVINKNGSEHRMAAEFRVFQAIIDERDFERAQEALDHSLKVMKVLDLASQGL